MTSSGIWIGLQKEMAAYFVSNSPKVLSFQLNTAMPSVLPRETLQTQDSLCDVEKRQREHEPEMEGTAGMKQPVSSGPSRGNRAGAFLTLSAINDCALAAQYGPNAITFRNISVTSCHMNLHSSWIDLCI
jgi:hypothetical protein